MQVLCLSLDIKIQRSTEKVYIGLSPIIVNTLKIPVSLKLKSYTLKYYSTLKE